MEEVEYERLAKQIRNGNYVSIIDPGGETLMVTDFRTGDYYQFKALGRVGEHELVATFGLLGACLSCDSVSYVDEKLENGRTTLYLIVSLSDDCKRKLRNT